MARCRCGIWIAGVFEDHYPQHGSYLAKMRPSTCFNWSLAAVSASLLDASFPRRLVKIVGDQDQPTTTAYSLARETGNGDVLVANATIFIADTASIIL